jgi:hypothetical protein
MIKTQLLPTQTGIFSTSGELQQIHEKIKKSPQNFVIKRNIK